MNDEHLHDVIVQHNASVQKLEPIEPENIELIDFGYRVLYSCGGLHDCRLEFNTHQGNLQAHNDVCTICYDDKFTIVK